MSCVVHLSPVTLPNPITTPAVKQNSAIPTGSGAANFASALSASFTGSKQQRSGASTKSSGNKDEPSNLSSQTAGGVAPSTSATPMLNLLALLSAGLQFPSTPAIESEADVEGVDGSHAKGPDASRPLTGSLQESDTNPINATISTPDQDVFTLKLTKIGSDEISPDNASSPEAFHLNVASSAFAQTLSNVASVNKTSMQSEMNSEQSTLAQMSELVADAGSAPVIEAPAHKLDAQAVHVSTTEPDANVAVLHGNETQKTDVRLQLQGDANERVDVRVLQDTSGFRVTVRSNDLLLARSLQEHIPELTTRLQQHQFQADVAMPAKASSAVTADTAANLRNGQDASPGNGDSSGRRRSTYTRDKKQTNAVGEANDSFSTLLALGR